MDILVDERESPCSLEREEELKLIGEEDEEEKAGESVLLL